MDQRLPPLGIFRPPTGSDVAREAGVSKSAVSRAFTGGVVSAEARERILKAARKLRYRPSLTARSLTTSQSKLIGVAVTHLDNQFYPDIIERLSLRLGAAGFRIVLFVTRGDADLEPMLDELLGYRLDGVVLASSSMAAEVAAECLATGVPVSTSSPSTTTYQSSVRRSSPLRRPTVLRSQLPVGGIPGRSTRAA